MKRLIFILALYIQYSLFNIGYSQDIHFSQFTACPLLNNPATAGAFNGQQRVITNYRNQWHSISTPYQTFLLSFDMGLLREKPEDNFLGLGMYIYSDKAGDTELSDLKCNFSVSYHLSLNNNNSLSAGLSGGFAQRSINKNKMQWGSQYNIATGFDPGIDPGETVAFDNIYHADFGSGILWTYYTKDKNMSSNDGFVISTGVSFFHFKQNISFYQENDDILNHKVVFHSNATVGMPNSNISIRPALAYYMQSSESEILFGSLVRYALMEESKYTGFIKGSAFSIGGYYRWNDAIIPVIQYEISKWAFGISYDINISSLSKATNGRGGIEIFLKFLNTNPFIYGRGSTGLQTSNIKLQTSNIKLQTSNIKLQTPNIKLQIANS